VNPFLAFVFGASLGVCLHIGWVMVTHRRERRRDTADYKHGFINGLELGARNHAEWIARHHGIPANGFAAACHACGNIQETILNHHAEWWTCGVCGHRQGAPLCESEVPF
jgi:hypothetical protein